MKSHRSALDRQITEAVLIQIAGPDMLLNSRGEWNIYKIPRLILDDEEPQEDWVSKRSKRKSISSDQGPSSITSGSSSGETGGGEGSMEYSVMSELSVELDVDVSNCNGSKTKKSRLAEPTLPITSGLSTAAEKDITRSDCTEFGTDCTDGGVMKSVVNALGKGLRDEKREENKRKKGKVKDLDNSAEKEVCTTVLPALPTGKRKYVKKDMAYWNSKKRKGKE